jgi:hypothetical protein
MAGEDWWRLADYVIARRVELGMRDRRAFAEASGVTERTLGKLENGQHVSPSTLAVVENRLGWAPGSCRRILAGGEPILGSPDLGQAEREDPTLWHIASTPGLPPDVVRGLVALARNWRQGGDGTDEQESRRDLLPAARQVALRRQVCRPVPDSVSSLSPSAAPAVSSHRSLCWRHITARTTRPRNSQMPSISGA